ncbi:MAG TPA: hypothetical protein VHZ03_17090 [Trebonia sp.]|jgi:hypothetical protein|nr:hypothetical protein [Trebonia sp.]
MLAAALEVVHHDGWYGLIANSENLIETWGGLYAIVRVGRWYRKVKPPVPKPRQEVIRRQRERTTRLSES